DFTEHRTLKLYRRINVLVFLNKDWKEEWGGELQLWDNKMTECQVKIAPVFNRVVVFSTLKDSFHGHPDPLLCPLSVSRKSIALYYYTKTIPQDPRLTTERQKTTFKVRPDEKADLVAIKGAWYKRWWNAIKP
ncbi:MAG: 2OG-Fe(II) oxygenase, partial [Marinoscillum sp.]